MNTPYVEGEPPLWQGVLVPPGKTLREVVTERHLPREISPTWLDDPDLARLYHEIKKISDQALDELRQTGEHSDTLSLLDVYVRDPSLLPPNFAGFMEERQDDLEPDTWSVSELAEENIYFDIPNQDDIDYEAVWTKLAEVPNIQVPGSFVNGQLFSSWLPEGVPFIPSPSIYEAYFNRHRNRIFYDSLGTALVWHPIQRCLVPATPTQLKLAASGAPIGEMALEAAGHFYQPQDELDNLPDLVALQHIFAPPELFDVPGDIPSHEDRLVTALEMFRQSGLSFPDA